MVGLSEVAKQSEFGEPDNPSPWISRQASLNDGASQPAGSVAATLVMIALLIIFVANSVPTATWPFIAVIIVALIVGVTVLSVTIALTSVFWLRSASRNTEDVRYRSSSTSRESSD
ncbi:hypothetical protein GCM10027535_34360 [Mycolicibacterium hippocampi]|uniref:Uncharacterized protein n=1 Tax=Mycolicibacterium hippocampi TaxID=659824 RepID=A0A7I9ZIW9_9MYCO|nr:hypothetical protein MHIP_14440 [Mycolicibacterium hippocampi]